MVSPRTPGAGRPGLLLCSGSGGPSVLVKGGGLLSAYSTDTCRVWHALCHATGVPCWVDDGDPEQGPALSLDHPWMPAGASQPLSLLPFLLLMSPFSPWPLQGSPKGSHVCALLKTFSGSLLSQEQSQNSFHGLEALSPERAGPCLFLLPHLLPLSPRTSGLQPHWLSLRPLHWDGTPLPQSLCTGCSTCLKCSSFPPPSLVCPTSANPFSSLSDTPSSAQARTGPLSGHSALWNH